MNSYSNHEGDNVDLNGQNTSTVRQNVIIIFEQVRESTIPIARLSILIDWGEAETQKSV